MKKAKKILSLLLCAILLVGATIAGTVAYLTDTDEVQNTFTVGKVHIELTETDTDRDNIIADNVEVTDEDGTTVIRDRANAYKLMPGIDVVKDPVVTVKAGSADCYVRVKVTVDVSNKWNNANGLFIPNETDEEGNVTKEYTHEEAFKKWANEFHTKFFMYGEKEAYGFNVDNWNVQSLTPDAIEETITYYLTYKIGTDNIVRVGNDEDFHLVAPFTYITPSKQLTSAQMAALAGMTINVEAHAMQADGFNGVETDAWNAFTTPNP